MGIRKTIPAAEIDSALKRISSAIALRHQGTENLVLLAIADGGMAVSRRLAGLLSGQIGRPVPHGVLSVMFHRDDLGINPIPDARADTQLPVDVDRATVILVDDVLFSGRTTRAALEEIFSHGRPTRVELAVLVDRGNRCLPIAADFVGFTEETAPNEVVDVVIDAADPAADKVTISEPA